MEELSGTQRKHLRGLAHDLKPLVQIGKAGLSEAVLAEMDRSLEGHELVKVRFLDFKSRKKEICAQLAEGSRAALVGLIGNVAIFYRPREEPAKRRITLP